ncbi:FecR family protein [Sphingomonas sp.]|uniref:FecR family protein n=1 Tax=Sphingomonas sp. TaxID=28214 RepID=UPI001B297F7F|nr:FecR family protein [Sphingomonas sp.]MBO9711645.1 FecR family protein [Sphingomonas sp.]
MSLLPTLRELQLIGPTRGAAFWLERLQGDETEAGSAVFEQWLAASEANRAAWDDALELWDSLEFAEGAQAFDAMREDALEFEPQRFAPVALRYAVAASLVLVVVVTLFVSLGRLGGNAPEQQVVAAAEPDPAAFGIPDYRTAVGERKTVELQDGSKLTLDTDSAVDVAYRGDQRMARLVRGQAFFEVSHDARRPFRVAAGERIVTVLGTRFNIRLGQDETRVVLVEGSVGISAGSDPAHPGRETERLAPGQQLVVRTGKPDVIGQVQTALPLEWRRGFIRFDGETLAEAVAQLNRYNAKKLVVRDPGAASLRISGAFPTDDPDGFVQTLTMLYPVRAGPAKDGEIEIVSRK